ncbi:putative 3-carboxymuconate cycloisomerase [Kineosporia sp. NBRC 101731]|nr:putative 3-carboxymuconate cycloisomerase [Kineosporia sp. NBRC 101731]
MRAGTPAEAAVADQAWVQAMLDAESALTRAQARTGTVPGPIARTITETARQGLPDVRALALASRETANPVVALISQFRAAVAARDEAAAAYVHRGSTSQDIFDTAAMLVATRALRIVHADLLLTAGTLAGLARTHRDTAMPGRTLALQAVPTTFGLKAAGWRHLVLEAADRVQALLDPPLPVSLGGAAGTLAGYLEYARLEGGDPGGEYARVLVEAFAEETGLRPALLPWHALRVPIADLASALAFTAGALGKIAVDVLSLARTEVGEVSEPGRPGRGASSAMPHKRNPVLATLIRSAALQVPALAGALTQCLVSEDERSGGVWHAEWSLLRECLRLTGGAAHTAAELVQGLRVHESRMAANLDLTAAQITSERLGVVLAPVLGPSEARSLLTRACNEADEAGGGRTLPEVLAEVPEIAARFSVQELEGLCRPDQYTGLAGALVDEALKSR